MRKNLLAVLTLVGAVACGGSDATDAFGGLEVSVRSVVATDIAQVTVTWTGPDNGSMDLTLTSDGWQGTEMYLRTGSYTASAEAFDSDGNTLFLAEMTDFTITHKNTTSLLLVFNQQTAPGEFTPPHFTSVVMNRAQVEQHESIHLTVEGAGGEGNLSLSGRHAQSDINAGTAGTFAAFATTPMSLTWYPPHVEGPAWFVLVLTDEAGNKAELGITVQVGPDRGNVTFSADWNMAPTFEVTSRVLNDGDAATIYLWVDADDDTPGTAALSYAWTDTCGFSFFEGLPATGSLDAPTTGAYFKADVARPDTLAACGLTLAVKDEEGAERSMTLNLHTDLLLPDVQ